MADKSLNKQAKLDDTIYDHRWGFKDSRFVVNPDRTVSFTGDRYAISGTTMPGLLPFAETILGVKIDINKLKPEEKNKPVNAPNKNEAFCTAVADKFPAAQFTFDDRERLIHSHGQTTADEVYKVLYTQVERTADMVFFPESDEDVAGIIEVAAANDVCLVPYGGGTSVSCALVLPTVSAEPRMICVVDMRRMNKILWIDRENMQAEVQAGITGKDLEDLLAAEGFTCGHEPDSIELSTLGGWIATNASGMKKNKYGNIEDVVENYTLVTPKGIVTQHIAMPRLAIGMQPHKLLFGNEGTLGLITKAVIRIHKLPEVVKYGSVVFPTFKIGSDFLYALMQMGTLPASIRLLDNVQFRFGSALKEAPDAKKKVMSKLEQFMVVNVKKFDPEELCVATIVMEGTADEVAYQEKVIYKLAKKFNGMKAGEGNGKRGYMLTYAIAYLRDFFAEFYALGETYETTVPWSKIHDVCGAVAEQVALKHKEYGLPGIPYISPRITQLYHTGVCIYFTHGFSMDGVDEPDRIFSEIEHSLRQTILDAGGSISHHHGVGKLRKDFLDQTVSAEAITLLHQVKQAVDPDNIFGIANNVFAE